MKGYDVKMAHRSNSFVIPGVRMTIFIINQTDKKYILRDPKVKPILLMRHEEM